MNLLPVVSDIALSLVQNLIGVFGLILKLPDDGVQLVRLVLQGLHLLTDGVHAGVIISDDWEENVETEEGDRSPGGGKTADI